MTGERAPGRDLTLLDAVCAVMDRPRRPLDFTVVVDVPRSLALQDLRAGARSARRSYPVTDARLAEGQWRPGVGTPDDEVRSATAVGEVTRALGAFVDEPFDLRTAAPVRQILIDDGERMTLASRFHHAAADGVSAAAWLGHQLEVALGHRSPAREPGSWAPPMLRRARGRVRRPAARRSARLWRRPGRPARTRRWRTIEIERPDAVDRFSQAGFTYSDLLTTLTLEMLDAWNRRHGAAAAANVGVWLPVVVRASGDRAFGNGTSRIRVHASYATEAPFPVKCAAVHRQIREALRSGEWGVPAVRVPRGVTSTVGAGLLRAYLSRPWADLGTAAFTHLDRWTGPPGAVFDQASSIACVSSLHDGHPLAITGVTRHHRTWLTFTYDAALLSEGDVVEMSDRFLECYAVLRRSMACAA